MHRITLAALFLLSIVASNLAAEERAGEKEAVVWTPHRNVKEVILKELDQFGKELKAKLGPKVLAHQPYLGVDGAFAETLAPTTVEQKIDHLLASLNKQAEHDNESFLPPFVGARRVSAASGSDFLGAPVLTPLGPNVGSFAISRPNWNSTETTTFEVVWEETEGPSKSNSENSEGDEVYEVQLNATLRLGVALTVENNGQLTVIDHSVAKPIVIGWRTSLVASAGKRMPIVSASAPAKSPDKADGQ